MNKKSQVLNALYNHCRERNQWVFHNEYIKDIAKLYNFGNPFDATKIDNSNKLPPIFIENKAVIIHLGDGYHQIINNATHIIFHQFEPIENTIQWPYQPSILNRTNSSESNILSIANNQRILHNFLFGQDSEFSNRPIIERPKTYFPHRTKLNGEYYINDQKITLNGMQLEIDLTLEFAGAVAVFEAKNGKADNFNILQLFLPCLYYHSKNLEKIKKIYGVYLVKNIVNKQTQIKLWQYEFTDPQYCNSITLVKSAIYQLMEG